jgi:hypothetical protein
MHIGYLLWERLGNVEAVAADVEEEAAIAEAVLEAGEVVADAVEGAEPLDKAGGDLLTKSQCGSRPELHSGRCHALPHGGRQLSWYFGDSSHGGGLTKGLDGVQRQVRLEIVLLGHERLPRFRALHFGGNTPTSCLVSYSQHMMAYKAPRAVLSRGRRRRVQSP